jgi:hypothetical protein
MHKLNVFLVAALVAGAAVLGTVAAVRTTSLGAAHASDSAVAQRTKQLDRFEASLRAQLKKQPPALPALPKPRAAAAAPAPRVVYRRPAPIVVVRHTHHGDDEGEHEAEGGGDD